MSIRSVKDDKLQGSIQSVQWLSRVRLSVSPWTTAGFPVHHQFREFTQTHVHWWWCHHPLSSPSPPAFNLSQHQSLFQWVSSSHQMAKVYEFQHQSFQWIFSNWTEEQEALCYRGEWLSWRQRTGWRGVRDELGSKLSSGLQVGVEWDSEVRKPNSKGSE